MDNKIIIKSGDESLVIKPKDSTKIDLREKTIQSISNLLNIENIVQIIYIDDKFDEVSQREEYKARLTKLKDENNYLVSEKFENLDWDSPTPKFETDITKLWEESEDKSTLLFEICEHDKDDEAANVIPALDFGKCFGERVKLMTPDQWIDDKYKVIKDLNEGQKAICLFDFEFQTGSERIRKSNGVAFVKTFTEQKELIGKVICGIFSHKFTEEEEDEFRDKYSNDYNVEKKFFYTISKRRFAFDPQITGFAEGVKNLLLQPHIELLKEESLTLLKESNIKAGDKIQEITPKTFNQIVQKSSLKEGIWEVNALFRLYGILSKVENFNMVSDQKVRQKFNESIKRIREIDTVETGYTSNIKNQQLVDLRNSELYISGDILNKLHLPLSNGDIFNIKGQEYMLLVQPCNIALRTEGNRSSKYDNAFLLPIKRFKTEKINHTKHEVYAPNNTSEEIPCVYFPEFKILSLDFLDLTVFNEDGKSSIDMTQPELMNDVIHTPWKERYKKIQKNLTVLEDTICSFKYVENNIISQVNEIDAKLKELNKALKTPARDEALKQLKEEKKHLKDHLKTIESSIYSIDNFESFKIKKLKSYDTVNRIFSFDIQRVKHYKSPYSDDLLQKFMLYLSRTALEHDFTEC